MPHTNSRQTICLYLFPPLFMWQQWTNGILGLWVIAVPFLGLTDTQNMWTLAISGLAIAVLGLWGASEHVSMERHGGMRHA